MYLVLCLVFSALKQQRLACGWFLQVGGVDCSCNAVYYLCLQVFKMKNLASVQLTLCIFTR